GGDGGGGFGGGAGVGHRVQALRHLIEHLGQAGEALGGVRLEDQRVHVPAPEEEVLGVGPLGSGLGVDVGVEVVVARHPVNGDALHLEDLGALVRAHNPVGEGLDVADVLGGGGDLGALQQAHGDRVLAA